VLSDNTHSKLGSNDSHNYIYTVVVIVCPVLYIIPFSSHRAFTHKHKAVWLLPEFELPLFKGRIGVAESPSFSSPLYPNILQVRKNYLQIHCLTLRRLMSYIYMEHPFLMFLDHTQRRSTVGRTPLDE